MNKKVKSLLSTLLCLSLIIPSSVVTANAQTVTKATQKDSISWSEALDKARAEFADGGGYATTTKLNPFSDPALNDGQPHNTWSGMDQAYTLVDGKDQPIIDVSKARPSFCSSATYMLLVRAIQIWDNNRNIISKDAWVNLKPITWPFASREDDGYGCFGRCNANGAGVGCFIKDVDAGTSYYVGHPDEYKSEEDYLNAWDQGKPNDFMKIFWNDGIGCDDNNSVGDERGHSVLYLGREKAYDENGKRDDWVKYWSSNGSKTDINAGYGIGKTRMSSIYRCVFHEVTNPANFNNAKNIAYDNVNAYCKYLNGGGHGTVASLKESVGYVDQYLLTVANGTGTGTYAINAPVAIKANAAPKGMKFKNWTSSNGGKFADSNSESTTFTMPNNGTKLTANYVAVAPEKGSTSTVTAKNDSTTASTTKKVANPKTGSENNSVAWAILLALSSTALLGFELYRRKRLINK